MITQEIQQVQQTMFIAGYRLVFCDNEVFTTWRCFRGFSLLGLLFQHSTHWSNGVDRIRYADPVAFCLERRAGFLVDLSVP